MANEIQACNNDICFKKNECERYKLFINGQTFVKRFGGKPHKGCGKFIQIEDK